MVAGVTLNHIAIPFPPLQTEKSKPSEGWFGSIEKRCSDYVLSGRIITDWQQSLMIAGVAAAIIGIIFTFFSGPSLLCGCFTMLLGVSATGVYCARKYAAMGNLQRTVTDLRQTQGRFEEIADNLKQENDQLHATNQQLTQTNEELRATHERFRQTHLELEATNQNLTANNLQFREANEQLAATNQNLQVRAQQFEEANQQFREENGRLHVNNQALEARTVQLGGAIQNLEAHNRQFGEENAHLQVMNENLQARVGDFQRANLDLKGHNEQLEKQVADLTLRVIQLGVSAERIHADMLRFQTENNHLELNVHGFNTSLELLKKEIDNSKALCVEIEKYLTLNRQGLGEQIGELRELITNLKTQELKELKRLIADLGKADAVDRKLGLLNKVAETSRQLSGEVNQLKEERTRIKVEIAHLEGIRIGFSDLLKKFEETDRNLEGNVDDLEGNVEIIRQERIALQGLAALFKNLLQEYLQPHPESVIPLPKAIAV